MIKPTKKEITEAVLKQLPYDDQSIEKTIRTWWFTMNGPGLRLTPLGDKKFQEASIEYYECPIKIKQASWFSFVLDCSKKLECPYYFGVNKVENQKAEPYVRLYDSKIAMMLTLYGDIQSYLDSMKAKR